MGGSVLTKQKTQTAMGLKINHLAGFKKGCELEVKRLRVLGQKAKGFRSKLKGFWVVSHSENSSISLHKKNSSQSVKKRD